MAVDDADLSGTLTGIYRNLRAGDQSAVTELWNHFRHRLLALARKTLSGRHPCSSDAEDALQSAFVSFWQRSERGDFGEDLNRDDLWNLMGLITVRKALKLQRSERAQKRGGDKTIESLPIEQISGKGSSVEFALTCEELLGQLEPDIRIFAVLRMMGSKNREIAEQLGCTERKVERKLNLIRAAWSSEIAKWTE